MRAAGNTILVDGTELSRGHVLRLFELPDEIRVVEVAGFRRNRRNGHLGIRQQRTCFPDPQVREVGPERHANVLPE